MTMDKVLITGGAGFSGAHICEHLLHNTDWELLVLDRLSYAGSLERLLDARRDFGKRIKFVYHDFRAEFPKPVLNELEGIKMVIHNGAETHVERSLIDPEPFVLSNVVGTMHVLNACRELGPRQVIYVSTDEVFGPAPIGINFKEHDPVHPSNPYSAAKAGGEALAYSYCKAFKLPVTITRTMNMFGERQHPEKFVPLCIKKILKGEKLIIHAASDFRIGSRKWLHARNQADALLFLLDRPQATIGRTFHIAGDERNNLEIAQLVAKYVNKPLNYELLNFHQTRPGHDLRYSLDDTKLRSLGWRPPVEFEESMRRTIEWTLQPENLKWIA